MGDRVAATTESIDPIDDLASDTDEEPAFKTEPGLIARIGISLSKRPKTIIVVVSFLITAALLINYQAGRLLSRRPLRIAELLCAVGRVVVALIAFWIDQPVPGFFVFVIIYTAAALLKLPVTEFVLAAVRPRPRSSGRPVLNASCRAMSVCGASGRTWALRSRVWKCSPPALCRARWRTGSAACSA